MQIGRFHAVTMTLAPALASVAVMSGSALLAGAASVLIASMVATAGRLRETNRSKAFASAVHGTTVVVLILALASLRRTTIDSVLVIVMLGIFNRFLLRGGHRDDFLIAGAASVLLSAATTITPGISFLLIILAFIPSLLFGLWASMMLGAAEGDQTDAQVKRAAIEAIARRPVPSGMGRITVLSLALTVIGFGVVSLLPRYTFSQALAAGYFMGLPGASSTMELRTNGAASIGDSTPVLHVEPAPGEGESVKGGLYARLYVLDRFDGRRFSSTTNGALFGVQLPIDSKREEDPSAPSEEVDASGVVQVTLNRLLRDSPEHPLAVLGRSRPAEIMRRNVRRTLGGTWVSGLFRGATLSYKARLDGPSPSAELPQHLRETETRTLLDVPADVDPRVVELGRSLTRDKETTRAKMDAVLAYFGRGFTYSLDPLPGDSPDPLVEFIFEARQGHCELFAAAVAVLLRAGGVKARVATGYYGGKWNALGGYLVFTQEDAHAWVEAYDDLEGWIWLDATPEDLRVRRKESLLGTVRDWYDAVEGYWFEHVIDFDEARRKQLVARLARDFAGFRDELFGGEGGGATSHARSDEMGIVVAGSVALFALIALLAQLGARRRGLDVEALGRRLRRALGAGAEENATLGALLARLEPARREPARRCVAAYEALRFGPPDAHGDPERLLAEIRALEAASRARRA